MSFALIFIVGLAQGGNSGGVDAAAFINIPVSIILGIAVGAVSGLVLHLFFEKAFSPGHGIRNSTKTVIVLAAAFFLTAAESFCGKISFSGLLAVVSMACVLRMKSVPQVSGALSAKFGKIWIAAVLTLKTGIIYSSVSAQKITIYFYICVNSIFLNFFN